MKKVYVETVDGYDIENMRHFVAHFFDQYLERIQSAKFILVKPNMLAAAAPSKAVTTHPVFVDAVLTELLMRAKGRVVLGDSPGANYLNYEKVLSETKLDEVASKHNIEIVRIEKYQPIQRDGYAYSSIVDEVDLIINLPKLKTHAQMGMTMAVKNLFGLIPGLGKANFHRNYPKNKDLSVAIYGFYKTVAPKVLNIMDAVVGMEGNGPSQGIPKKFSFIAASDDAVSLDMAVVNALGLTIEQSLTTLAAKKDGYQFDYTCEGAFPKELSIKLPISWKSSQFIPSFLMRAAAKKIWVKPFILQEKCVKCGLCKRSCPVSAIVVDKKQFIVVDNKCIECFCCHEVCESDAIILKRSLLHRLVL